MVTWPSTAAAPGPPGTLHGLIAGGHRARTPAPLTPDCGFATFAGHPIAPAARAEATLRALAEAAALVRRG
jgi:hypothetical protein